MCMAPYSTVSYPINQKGKGSLERLNQYASRLISNDFNWNHNYLTVRAKAWLKPIYQITIANRLCLTYKYDRKLRIIPECLLPYQINSGLRRSTRSSHDRALVVPYMTKTRCSKSVLVVNAKLWNGLSNEVILQDFVSFRKYAKSDQCLNFLLQ